MVGKEKLTSKNCKTMKMNRKNIFPVIAVLLAGLFSACSDWTEPEARDLKQELPASYYADLKAYKASDHALAFGWFDGWNPVSASTAMSLMGIPDSVDLVAIWSPFIPSEEQKADMRAVREKKGTKVVVTTLLTNIGLNATPDEVTADAVNDAEIVRLRRLYWGWSDDASAAEIEAAIRKYANAMVDLVLGSGYDGLDIDFEPSYAGHYGNIVNEPNHAGVADQGDIFAGTTADQRVNWFVDECSKRLGPKSGSGKLLIVDGELHSMPVETIDCFDYFILQTYSLSEMSVLDDRLERLVTTFDGKLDAATITRKLIVTENFEPAAMAAAGGVTWTLDDGSQVNSLQGMALWEPYTGVRKGGVGAYKMQNDFKNDCYRYYRQIIATMNPAQTNR